MSGVTQPFDMDAMRADMEAGTPGPWHIKAKSVPMSIEGNTHQVTDAASFPAAFVPAWDNPEPGETDGTEEALANARRIASVPDMEAKILRLVAENERLREGCISAAAALSATISLLERGGRKAAPSNRMFEQMLKDYQTHLDTARAALGGQP